MDVDRDEEMRKKAYHKWESEGRPEGEHERHWRDAEAEFSTAESEELTESGNSAEEPNSSNSLPKVGEFSSANK